MNIRERYDIENSFLAAYFRTPVFGTTVLPLYNVQDGLVFAQLATVARAFAD